MSYQLNSAVLHRAIGAAHSGSIDRSPWSESQPADKDRDKSNCIGHDPSAAGTQGEYGFPIFTKSGKLSAPGVAAALGRARTNAPGLAASLEKIDAAIKAKGSGSIRASGDSLVLHAANLAPGRTVPMALTGLPSEISGQPVHYFKKELARVGSWLHRGQKNADGSAVRVDIPAERMDRWVTNFKKRLENGIRPFIPGQHRAAFSAEDNHGFLIDVQREGDSLYGTLQLIGDDALALTAKNDVSIYVEPEAIDANGNEYDEVLAHVALTPNPALPHLSPFVKIAASADAPARDVPVFELGAPLPAGSPRRSFLMKPETAQKVRAQLGLGADVPDDQLDDKAAEKALALSADLSALTKERDTLKTERDAAKADADAKAQQVLALSADRPKPDALTLSMFQENIAAKREAAVSSGVVSEAEAKLFDELLAEADGRPTPLALSACGTKKRPLGFEFWDRIGKLTGGGIRTGNAVERGIPADPLSLSADDPKAKETKAAYDQAKAWREQQLDARGLKA